MSALQHRPWLILAIAIGAMAGLGSYTFDYAEGLSYLSNDPKACVNCHVMRDQYDGWQKASHHGVATCNDCHVPQDFLGKYLAKMDHGYRHSKGFTLEDFHEPIRVHEAGLRELQDNCIRCHGEFVSAITHHSKLADDIINCVRCHRDVGHGPSR